MSHEPSSAPWSDLQLDALRELSNIGAGAAATRLYERTGTLVRMHVPRSTLLLLPDQMGQLGDAAREVTAVVCQADGDVRMLLALLLDPADATTLAREAAAQAPAEAAAQAPAEAAAQAPADARAPAADRENPLLVLGRDMCRAFLDALAQTAHLSVEVSGASTLTDMRGAILQSAVALAGDSVEAVLIVDTRLDVEQVPLSLTFLCLPQDDGVQQLLQGMGVASPQGVERPSKPPDSASQVPEGR